MQKYKINKIFGYSLHMLALLSFISVGARAQVPDVSKRHVKISTVVIDPGHGGKDSGAPGCDKRTVEKSLVLNLSKKLRDKIEAEFPDVKVILTRETDEFIPLLERAEIANRNNADLFISMHVNSNKKSTPHGFSAHILGESSNKNKDVFANNMDVCKTENSVITLEEDYSVKYAGFDPSDPSSAIIFELMQNAYYEQSLLFASYVTQHMSETSMFYDRGISQDNFYVLWRTYMPSVLIECGFISNTEDIRKLKTENCRNTMVDAIFEGFKEFKCNYEGVPYLKSGKPAVQKKKDQSPNIAELKPEPTPATQLVIDAAATAKNDVAAANNNVADQEAPASKPLTESGPDKLMAEAPLQTNPNDTVIAIENKAKHLFPGDRKASSEATIEAEVERPAFTANQIKASQSMPEVSTPSAQTSQTSAVFGIQVLVSAKRASSDDSYFKGYNPTVYQVGKYYKYVVGVSSTVEEVKKMYDDGFRKTFPGSFVVKIENDKVSAYR